MANSNQADPTKTFYLDDLHVGQRFTSATHLIDEEQIKTFARQFDPQPFHLDAAAAKGTLFEGLVASGWHTAAILCGYWWKAVCPSLAALLGPVEKLVGQSRRGRVLSSV
jgi:acyl dehydratase